MTPKRRSVATPLAALLVAAIVVLGVFAYSSLSTNESTATSEGQACGGYLPVWPSSQTGSIPVLLMQPGSTGIICVHYRYAGGYGDQNLTSLEIGSEQCYGPNGSQTCQNDPSESFSTTGALVSPLGSLYRTNVTVIYGVTAASNSTGFYDNSAPFDNCGSMPLAVGYSADEVNATDFPEYLNPDSVLCFNIVYFPASVSVSGMTVTYLPNFGVTM